MRLNTLKLLAFGPFTDTVIDLSRGERGLHLIYGPNEAGKSSALRGLTQLLFGIPARTPDDFIHSYPNLRIGAELEDGNGSVLSVVRRKAKANTLRGEDDVTIVDEEELQALLRGEDEATFRTRFGIDLDELQQGSHSILKGEGRIGEMLFAAGSGLSGVRQVLDALQSEAETLYKTTGKKPPLNSLLGELAATKVAIRDIQLSGSDWAAHDKALRKAKEKKMAMDADYEDKRREQARLERIQSGHPLLAHRKELLKDLAACSEAPSLPAGFAERWRDLLLDMKVAAKEERSASKEREAIRSELEGIDLQDVLLEQAEAVEALHQEQGGIAKAATDRHKLAGELGQAEEDLQRIQKGLPGLGQAQDNSWGVLDKGGQGLIQELASRYERLDSQLEAARRALAENEPELAAVQKELADLNGLPDVSALSLALTRLDKEGDLTARLAEERRTLELERKKLVSRLERLGRFDGDLEQAVRAAMPDAPTIDRFEGKFSERAKELVDIEGDVRRAESELAAVDEGLAGLGVGGDGPSEDDLRSAREERDRGWGLVRRTWNLKLPPDDAVQDFVRHHGGEGSLADAFEYSLRQTDHLADRLRLNAVSRAEHHRLVTTRDRTLERIERLQSRAGKIKTAVEELQSNWDDAWRNSGVAAPGSPVEMRLWLHEFHGLVERMENLGEKRTRLEGLEDKAAGHMKALSAGLKEARKAVVQDVSLDVLADMARQVAAHVEGLRTRQKELESRHSDLLTRKAKNANELARIEQELNSWRMNWGEAIAPLGLSKEAVPSQVRAVLEEMRKQEALDVRKRELSRRIQGIDHDATRFAERVEALIRDLMPSLAGQQPFEAMAGLYRALRQAQRSADLRERLGARLADIEAHHAEISKEVSRIGAQIEAMCEEAGCRMPEEMTDRIKDSEHRAHLNKELEQVEQQMRHLSGGMELPAFVAELESVDSDAIATTLEALEDSVRSLDRERSELDQAIGKEQQILSTMDGNAKAAVLAQDAEDIAARIEGKVEQYVRLRLAWTVLNRAVESYREKNQGPILTRSGELFRELTKEAYAGLRVEYDRKDTPVLVGVRPDTSSFVHVEHMSDGTRDQLYLAIRLASLVTYVERKGPMPFIVDDVLVNFDDDRSLAALNVLARLSDQTQIIFFTHHRHLVDMAAKELSKNKLFVHGLQA